MHGDDISPVTSPGGLPVDRCYALLVTCLGGGNCVGTADAYKQAQPITGGLNRGSISFVAKRAIGLRIIP